VAYGSLLSRTVYKSKLNPIKLYLFNEKGQGFNKYIWIFIFFSAFMPAPKAASKLTSWFFGKDKNLKYFDRAQKISFQALTIFLEDSESLTQDLVEQNLINRLLTCCITEDTDN
jgi:hypothetical protein